MVESLIGKKIMGCLADGCFEGKKDQVAKCCLESDLKSNGEMGMGIFLYKQCMDTSNVRPCRWWWCVGWGGGCNWVPQARGLGDNFLANFATPRSLSF